MSAGDAIKQGQVIATLSQTEIAAGSNLFFAATVGGEAINPLTTE